MKNVEFYLNFLENTEVTGNDEPPALEGMSYATEHLGFIASGTSAKLTGKVALIINSEDGTVVSITGSIPSTQLEVTTEHGEYFWVLPHRIKLASKSKKIFERRK